MAAMAGDSLSILPNELLGVIASLLDGQPPSEGNFNRLPNPEWTASNRQCLKALSSVSHRLRLLVLPQLFRHAKLDPCYLTDFLDFVHKADLAHSIETIVAHVLGAYSHIHPAWYVRLLNEIPVKRMTVGCKPHIFAKICQINLNLQDAWAFDIPYQLLELRQSPGSAVQSISYDSIPSLLTAKQWDSIRVNEGSSLAAYTSYEYFLKKPPSLMSNVNTYLNTAPANANPEPVRQTVGSTISSFMSIQLMLETLREFSFVAIFPFYNHVDEVLKCIRRMSNLRKIYIKLCPEPDSTALNDAVNAAGGHIDLNDPWAE